ncbi:hypothetical protein IMSAG049_01223 [Clostridiales bacterium]|nr:hypothetical protein IMSAG049_01223 [Clostridiales bacterium]
MAKISTDGKTVDEMMEMADEISRGYFKQGLNCAECVLRTYLDMHDTDVPDSVIRMATGFGGGMGHTKNTCGAMTGAVLALGLSKGRDPFEKETVPERIKHLQGEVYPVFGEMVTEMKNNYGTLICSELSDPFGDFGGKERKKNCMEMIAYCAKLAEKYANK